jgi:hypothetical protein
MKVASTIALFASLAAALPNDLVVRQTVGSTSNDYGSKCWPILFVFARGSTETGNMVRLSIHSQQ